MDIIFLLNLILVILVVLILGLGGAAIYILYKRKMQEQSPQGGAEDTAKSKQAEQAKQQGRDSVQRFMEFDDVIDNMIVRKGRTQYVMVIQCKGINYDLLSEEEKQAVENGFTQFLNTLRYPIQLYVQTRSLNLRDIIDEYKQRVNVINDEVKNIDIKIRKAKAAGNIKQQERLEFEKRRKTNVLDYGNDISSYIEKMSMNQNVLQQNTYVIVSYYTAEFGGEISNYSKEEIDNMCFAELYTRAQTVIRSLASAEVYGRVLDSEELAELLYVAYNRDESEILNLKRALDAEYDSFYATAPDIIQKKMEKIEREVEEEAAVLATASLLEADKIKALERNRNRKVKERAKEIISDYKDSFEPGVYEEAVNQIENNAENLIGLGEEEEPKDNTPKRGRKKRVS